MKELQFEKHDNVQGAVKENTLRRFKEEKINDGIYECEECSNHGYIIYFDENDEMKYQQCRCYQIRQARRKMRDLGLLKYCGDNNSFDEFIATEQWEKRVKKSAMDFVNNYHNKFFYIGGQIGAGKTKICSLIICNILMKARISYEYIIWGDTARTLAFDDKNKKEMEYLKEIELLYIDDFLRSTARNELKITQWERDVVMELINYRYINNKTTIISSELYFNELAEVDDSVASRIYENSDNGKYCLSIKREKNRNKRLVKTDIL